ncbi:MAG: pyridoxamine 5'-phosphate oxidase family protein [Acidobacteria bacterium]|nr:pyridoxamine 5'-phosphate oxidase family protein [Acidobacteriota bacterium]
MDAIRTLLHNQRVLSLAVVVDGQPEAGLLPYAVRDDLRAVFVQASGLARHARGLQEGAVVGVLIHAQDTPDADPMQLPRLSVSATVHVLEKGTEPFAKAAARFIERFPTAAMTLELGDFNLYELTLGRGRYVEGFARAINVSGETFKEL